MKRYKKLFTMAIVLSCIVQCASAPHKDTLTIPVSNLRLKHIQFGNAGYLVYNGKTKDAPAECIYLVNKHDAPVMCKQQAAVEISQRWDGGDNIIHQAFTVINGSDFSTRLHQTSWKQLTYTPTFDFDDRKVSFEEIIADSNKQRIVLAFDGSFSNYNLNRHSDLFIFMRLPYKTNRIFRINFSDPGFGRPSEEIYSRPASDVPTSAAGKKSIAA